MSELSYLEKLLDGAEVEWLTAAEIFNIKNGYTPSKAKKEFWEDGNIPWFRLEDIRTNGRELNDSIMHVNQAGVKGNLFPKDSIFMSTTATIGEFALVKIPHLTNQQITNFSLTSRFKGIIDIRYLFHRFHHFGEWCKENANKSGGLSIIGIKKLSSYKFPIPCPDNPEKSLAIQSEIVRILDKFTALTAELTAELTARKKQYNYYRDQLLSFDEKNRGSHLEKLLDGAEVKWVPLGNSSYFEIANNGRKPVKSSLRTAGETPYYGANNIQDYVEGYTHDGEYVLIAEDGSASLEQYSIQYAKGKFWANNHVHVVRGNDLVDSRYLYHYLCIANFIPFLTGGTRAKLTKGQLVEISVPIPYPNNPEKSLAIQSEIVRVLDKFNTLTNSISEGLPREIELRQQQYEYYRDLLFSFPKPEIAQNTH